jgi:hypothetical protein
MDLVTKIIVRNRVLSDLFLILSKFERKQQNKCVFLTIANRNFFFQLVVLIDSLRKFESEKLIIYDIGLSANQKAFIIKKFINVEITPFKFEDYPPHFNLKINHGSYAWKIAALHEVFFKYKCDLIYLDARNYVTDPFYAPKYYLAKKGYYFPFASGKIKDWTHPETLKHFNNSEIENNFNLNASFFGISFNNYNVRALVEELFSLSLIEGIISPEGSNRQNHRFDQSLLSCIFYKIFSTKPHSSLSSKVINVITHFDIIATSDFINKCGEIKNYGNSINLKIE